MLDWLKRLGLRWVMLYLVLYIVSIAKELPGFHVDPEGQHSRLWFMDVYTSLWIAVVAWTKDHVLHLTVSYVEVVCMLVLAFVGAVLWTSLDRDRQRERIIYEATRILVRYALAAGMLDYGLEKIWHLQFPYPGPSLLMTPFGALQPVGLMWAFLGYSTLYSLFGGLVEFIGGALLFFRRTTTLGALLVAGAMTNVLMMNFSFDLGANFYAGHLLLMAIFLMAPDVLRLTPALVLGRAVAPITVTHMWPKGWMRPASLILKVLVIGLILYYVQIDNIMWSNLMEPADKTGLAGLYRVERFRSTGKSDALLMSDGKLWQRVAIQPTNIFYAGFQGTGWHETMTVRTADDAIQYFPLQVERIDAKHGRFILTRSGDAHLAPIVFRYVVVHSSVPPGSPSPKNDMLALDGKVDGAAISLRLDRMETNNYPLMNYRFMSYRFY